MNLRFQSHFEQTFNDLLVNHSLQAVVPRVVLAKLHSIRKEVNRAAHGEAIDQATSRWLRTKALFRVAYQLRKHSLRLLIPSEFHPVFPFCTTKAPVLAILATKGQFGLRYGQWLLETNGSLRGRVNSLDGFQRQAKETRSFRACPHRSKKIDVDDPPPAVNNLSRVCFPSSNSK